ncbi:hypothetical protein [Shinella sp.]|uniref:hypothetical protein n=1 Tax=Shinella sp. TaxID=1870904 RepID=UPI0040363F08
MATPEIDERFLTAGREYGDALVNLGLEPHALFWAYDNGEQRHILVLVTDFFDFKGPLEISKQLFRAYNASVTPKEIDPFTVRLHSINQSIGEEYRNFAGSDGKFKVWDKNMVRKPLPEEARVESMNIGDITMKPTWTICVRPGKRRTGVDLSRRWERFTRNVDRAAA